MSLMIWSGETLPLKELESRLPQLAAELKKTRKALAVETVLEACEALSKKLHVDPSLRAQLMELVKGEPDAAAVIDELSAFLKRDSLEEKILRELCGGDASRAAFRLERTDAKESIFETWAPLGVLVHIAPTNSANVPFLSIIEGLLTGNINFLKIGAEDTGYPVACARALVECGPELASFVYAAPISSKKRELLKLLLSEADGVAVWGAEEAISGVRELAPSQARVIEWGPKISFAYVEEKSIGGNDFLVPLAEDCCRYEQQACSSPQVIYVDTSDSKTLLSFAERFAETLASVSKTIPIAREPFLMEHAEMTKVETLARLETSLEGNFTRKVLSGDGWKVFVDGNPALKASPLFRTVWIKALPKDQLREVLRPMRAYLQTAALVASATELARLSKELFACGVLRVTSAGEMLGGYSGEPHDGVYSLQRYCRRVGVRLSGKDADAVKGVSSLDELCETPRGSIPRVALLTKEAHQLREVDSSQSELFFKSGGSSGDPKLSIFTYDDYHRQMRIAAEGLVAAGLEPSRDRCMNLFFSGGLYGGFLSFFSILESLSAVQFPMAAHLDFPLVAKEIVRGNVTTLLGMPSYLLRLFEEEAERLSSYRRVEKIFYGGEHFSDSQKEWLQTKFGVELIRSAVYGGNDTGPMGYQCSFCRGGEHHLFDRLHALEIVKLDRDEPAQAGETGRLVFTAKMRRGQAIERYEVGDLGRWTEDNGKCACGRTSPKFELLGRYGDVFRAAGMFFNYGKFQKLLPGEVQLVLEKLDFDKLTVRYAADLEWPSDRVRKHCLENYTELYEVAVEEKSLEFVCEPVSSLDLERNPGSGKLRHIVDKRT